MPRVVINSCYGGFGLSDEAEDLYRRYSKQDDIDHVYFKDASRADPTLIRVIEEIGCDAASKSHSKLKIITVPDDVEFWKIMEYDGMEWVAERHRTWH